MLCNRAAPAVAPALKPWTKLVDVLEPLKLLRRCLSPKPEGGWPPFLWLLFLGFLFMPLTWHGKDWSWLWATLISLPVFLVLYVRFVLSHSQAQLAYVLGIALLAYALAPFNGFANTYLIYAAGVAPLLLPGVLRPLLLVFALLVPYTVEVLLLSQPPLVIAIAVLMCTVVSIGTSFSVESRRRNSALRLSQEEVRRLAALAERERISRDLHDLLGHTLSLIAIKGELAGKLVERDLAAATREIADLTAIARDALTQVRTAITGMRSAALAGELASARALLESCGVQLTCQQDTTELPAAVENALAMIVREAATNIQRHASATCATVQIRHEGGSERSAGVALRVSDNGKGGVVARGNGLAGISERVHALGGSLEIRSLPGEGTVLLAHLPVAS